MVIGVAAAFECNVQAGQAMAASFFGSSNRTPSRGHSSQATRLTASSALELISAEESRSMPHERRQRRNPGRVRTHYVNDENVLPYQPGMLLSDRPPVCNSDSDLDGDEDNPYTFSDVRSSRNNTNPEITQIKMMVQQQQAMMRAILTNQDTIQERQTLHEEKVTQLEGRLVQHSTPSSSDGSPNTAKKRKRIVNRGISVSAMESNRCFGMV